MSPDALQNIGVLLNMIGFGFLFAAQLEASRDRDRRERATDERPQPIRQTPRSRVRLSLATGFVGLGAVLITYGIIAG